MDKKVIRPRKQRTPNKLKKSKKPKTTPSSSSSRPTSSSKPINEEIALIEDCCKNVGEAYRFLGVPYDATNEEIQEAFNEIGETIKNEAVAAGPNISEEDQLIFEYRLECCILAFNILTNSRLRHIYDTQYLENMINYENELLEKEIGVPSIKESLFILLSSFISKPLETIQNKIISMPGINSSLSIIKTIFKDGKNNSNILVSLFRNYPLSVTNSVLQIIANSLTKFALDGIIVDKNNNKLKSVLSLFLYALTRYPIHFIMECVYVAPFSMSIFEIIRKIVLRESVNEITHNHNFQFKNLFYSITSGLVLYTASKFISNSIQNLENLFFYKAKNNPNSNKWKYGAMIYCNPITQGILTALVLWPIKVIRVQYPIGLVQSYLTNSPIPIVINPISMAIKVYKEQGWRKFFDGIISVGFPYYILKTTSNRLLPDTDNLYDV